MAKILVLHGPNLNLLGDREPEYYGRVSLKAINERLEQSAASDNNDIECKQSNAENELVDWVQQAEKSNVDFIIINPAAFTHTSVAIRDALSAVEIPFIEIHLSNVHAREAFRRHSYFSDIAKGVIAGFGSQGYDFAYQSVVSFLKNAGE